jgi:hypothetical protein
VGLRMNLSLVKCGKCGRRYSNPLTHVCVNPRRRGRTRVKPRLTYDCPRCGKPVTNPLTHVCRTRTDFRKRLRDQKRKRPAARPAAPQHDYHSCRDPDCQRRACTAYREGFADGIDNCPGPHA